jgi:hypothetical protein
MSVHEANGSSCSSNVRSLKLVDRPASACATQVDPPRLGLWRNLRQSVLPAGLLEQLPDAIVDDPIAV